MSISPIYIVFGHKSMSICLLDTIPGSIESQAWVDLDTKYKSKVMGTCHNNNT